MKKGIFNFHNPKDMLKKLQREYRELKADPYNSDKATNFFTTAESLPDWIENVKIKYTHVELRVCSHLATGAKHYKITNQNKKSVDSTKVEKYVNDDYVEKNYFSEPLMIYLSNEEANEMGVEFIEAPELAQKIILFWEKYFE